MERQLWKRVYQMVNDIANGSSVKPAIPQDLVVGERFCCVSGLYFWIYGDLVVLS